jgi:SOS response regulatory protein OraA/RecX
MKKNILVSVAILVLALVLSLATAVAAFADTSGQGSSPGSGFRNRMQNEYIQALASASGETTAQIQTDVTNGQTVAQIAQQLASAGTITETSLATAIQQVLASEDQTRAANMAQALISGQMAGGQGNSGQSGQPGNAQYSGRQNGGQGTGQGSNMLVQALATASGETTAQIQTDVTNGQTVAQIAQQLASAGTITQASLAAAIQTAMSSNDQTRAATDAQALISGQMPGRQGGNSPTTGSTTTSGIVLTIGSSRMYVNGTAQDIDPGYQTSPVIKNSRAFIPIRAIIEKLGGTVTWDAADQQLTITLNNTTIVLSVGSTTATVNGVATTLDDAPYVSASGRTMLPLRFIMENLGGHTVNWDSNARTITIQ